MSTNNGLLLKYFFSAKEDIKSIDKSIKEIDKERQEIDNIKKQKGWLNGEHRYLLKQLEYFKEKNIKAREEIVHFILYEIDNFALLKEAEPENGLRISTLLNSILGKSNNPYRYSQQGLLGSAYDFRGLSDISNKFLDFPAGSHKKIRQLYEENQSEFFAFAEAYIYGKINGTRNKIEEVKDLIKNNHILNKRKDFLHSAINNFIKEDYVAFSTIIPLQIEGIFDEICSEFGVNESELDISALNKKLDILLKKFSEEPMFSYYFEYYSFKFPIIRNTIAHGKFIESDIKQTALMLMLDLLPVCELTTSQAIPINKIIKLINEINKKSDYKLMIEYIDHLDFDIPSFYELNEDCKNILKKYEEEGFWDFVEKSLEKEEHIKTSTIYKRIKKLHSKKIAEQQCFYLLKKISTIQENGDHIRKKQAEFLEEISKRIDK